MIFFEDPEALTELKRAKQRAIIKSQSEDSEVTFDEQNESQFNNVDELSMPSLKKELRTLRRKNIRKDCYSLVKEEKTRNPFMRNIAKSSQFNPSMGVIHRDRADNPNSDFCSGGPFKSKKEHAISRKDFELRQSMSNLRLFGPQSARNMIS